MRIFVLGAGATGSLLAQLLERQGHTVWCGDRDPERARRFLGKRSTIAVTEVNARNLRGIAKVAKGCQLIVNASASVFNEIVLRAHARDVRFHAAGSGITRRDQAGASPASGCCRIRDDYRVRLEGLAR